MLCAISINIKNESELLRKKNINSILQAQDRIEKEKEKKCFFLADFQEQKHL